MRVRVRYTVPEVDPAEFGGATAVVVDLLRATSTIVAALSAGARGIYPAASTEEALRLAQSLGREDTLLCGERKGVRIEGYDLGNSPAEFTRDVIADKRLVLDTTNGTSALLAVSEADRVFATSLVNLAATGRTLEGTDDVLIVCAGREGAFALEDAVCAGALIAELGGPEALDLDDGARAAYVLASRWPVDT
ncbi:MAG TPA: 2-phosphosulfolactate phosphatase, partial [Longimicrobiales bacterium]|nr:2-phosphosulfolactate phosphatase [Longimicrobiales bacterium]